MCKFPIASLSVCVYGRVFVCVSASSVARNACENGDFVEFRCRMASTMNLQS